MRAAHVAALVGARADQMRAEHEAMLVTNDTHGLKIRVNALEKLVGALIAVLLADTSADPDATLRAPAKITSKPKKAAK